MIDEKRLDRLEEHLKGPYFSDGTVGFHIKEATDLVRLARLGLALEKGDGLQVLGLSVEQVELLKNFYEIHTGKDPLKIQSLTDSFSRDGMDRLLRLGLWAEKHAIPHLGEQAEYECYVTCICQDKAKEVLAALPKPHR